MLKSRFLPLIALAAAILFNNWILGIFLNNHLFLTGGSVSEFSASTQPYHWLFRLLDIVSGLLLAGLGILIYRLLAGRRYYSWLGFGLLILGLSNCMDAVLPLPCSGTVDAHCNAPVRISLHRVSLPTHVFSSTLIGLCYVLIPLAVYLYANRVGNQAMKLLSWVVLVSTLLFFGLLALESFYESSVFSHLAGYSQELQMILLGWLFVKITSVASREPVDPL